MQYNSEIIPNHSVEMILKQTNKKITTPTKQKPILLLMECGNDQETCNSMEMRILHLIALETEACKVDFFWSKPRIGETPPSPSQL